MSSAPALRHSPAAYPSLLQIWALDTSVPTDLERATSKEEKGRGMTFELGLCVGVGEAWSVQWCPKGGADSADGMDVDSDDNDAKLGIIAGAFTDGSISLFAVPDPVALRAQRKTKAAGPRYGKPLLLFVRWSASLTPLRSSSGTPSQALSREHELLLLCLGISRNHRWWLLEWCVDFRLFFSFETDSLPQAPSRSGPLEMRSARAFALVRLYRVNLVLLLILIFAPQVRPAQYFPVHTAIIRSITFIRSPPLSPELDGSPDLDGEPTRIATIGYDGTANVVDLQDPNVPLEIWHERGTSRLARSLDRGDFADGFGLSAAGTAIAFSSWMGTILSNDAENQVRASSLYPSEFGTSKKTTIHRSTVWVSFFSGRVRLETPTDVSRSQSPNPIIIPWSCRLQQTGRARWRTLCEHSRRRVTACVCTVSFPRSSPLIRNSPPDALCAEALPDRLQPQAGRVPHDRQHQRRSACPFARPLLPSFADAWAFLATRHSRGLGQEANGGYEGRAVRRIRLVGCVVARGRHLSSGLASEPSPELSGGVGDGVWPRQDRLG